VTALPADPPQQEDPLNPERILRSLPERERETFLAEYRRAVDDARDPTRWPELRRFLRLWAWRAVAVTEPGYYEAWDGARTGTGGGMLLADALQQYHPGA
jgi:Family of unknown function (DUF6247)